MDIFSPSNCLVHQGRLTTVWYIRDVSLLSSGTSHYCLVHQGRLTSVWYIRDVSLLSSGTSHYCHQGRLTTVIRDVSLLSSGTSHYCHQGRLTTAVRDVFTLTPQYFESSLSVNCHDRRYHRLPTISWLEFVSKLSRPSVSSSTDHKLTRICQ